jgi:hypothetical protein
MKRNLRPRHDPAERDLAIARYEYRRQLAKRRKSQGKNGPAVAATSMDAIADAPTNIFMVQRVRRHRRSQAIRFAKLVRAYGKGLDPLGAHELAIVRSAAATSLELEALHEAMRNGEKVNAKALTRLTNSNERLLRMLQKLRKPIAARADAPSVPSLGEHLARLAQRKAMAIAAPGERLN